MKCQPCMVLCQSHAQEHAIEMDSQMHLVAAQRRPALATPVAASSTDLALVQTLQSVRGK